MKKGITHIFCGEGKGKTPAAIGMGIQAAIAGKRVIIIEFLKGRYDGRSEFIQRLEPDVKLFRFERSDAGFDSLTEQERQEECQNIKNGLNFARKVLSTQGCDVLILDELIGLPAAGIISWEEIRSLMRLREDEMSLIITGNEQGRELWDLADEVTVMQSITHEKL